MDLVVSELDAVGSINQALGSQPEGVLFKNRRVGKRVFARKLCFIIKFFYKLL